VAALLSKQGREWSLAGGLAVSARTQPRFTRDVDLTVLVDDDAQAEATVRALRDAGYQVLATVEQEATRRLATARLLPPGERPEGVIVDLLFFSSGIEPEIVRAAERVEIVPGLQILLPRIGHLIAVKVLARDDRHRPQDLADLRALLDVATDQDLELARTALELIKERGCHRNKDLKEEWTDLLRLVGDGPAGNGGDGGISSTS
jgi:predicted nucleotidyltransferase